MSPSPKSNDSKIIAFKVGDWISVQLSKRQINSCVEKIYTETPTSQTKIIVLDQYSNFIETVGYQPRSSKTGIENK